MTGMMKKSGYVLGLGGILVVAVFLELVIVSGISGFMGPHPQLSPQVSVICFTVALLALSEFVFALGSINPFHTKGLLVGLALFFAVVIFRLTTGTIPVIF